MPSSRTLRQELSPRVKALVNSAIIKLPAKGGLGVLVKGGFILTAAHCITWSGDGAMALGELFESIVSTSGQELLGQVLLAEPVADIAVLGAPDNQEKPNAYSAFKAFARSAVGIKLLQRPPRNVKPVNVWVRTHLGKFLPGTMRVIGSPDLGGHRSVWLESRAKINGGTSGGPVVDRIGRLIGVVSNSPEQPTGDYYVTQVGVAIQVLPRWMGDTITGTSTTL